MTTRPSGGVAASRLAEERKSWRKVGAPACNLMLPYGCCSGMRGHVSSPDRRCLDAPGGRMQHNTPSKTLAVASTFPGRTTPLASSPSPMQWQTAAQTCTDGSARCPARRARCGRAASSRSPLTLAQVRLGDVGCSALNCCWGLGCWVTCFRLLDGQGKLLRGGLAHPTPGFAAGVAGGWMHMPHDGATICGLAALLSRTSPCFRATLSCRLPRQAAARVLPPQVLPPQRVSAGRR